MRNGQNDRKTVSKVLFHKINKNMPRGGMFYTFTGMTALTTIKNFVT